jgi:hypothetical protein
MLQRMCAVLALAALSLMVGQAPAAESDLTAGLKMGTVELKSAGPLAFGPQGILFIGDPSTATIYALDTGDRIAPKTTDRPNVEGVDAKIASLLGVEAVLIKGLAVNPISGTTYLSVARGTGPTAAAVLLKMTRSGKLEEVGLKDVKSAKATISNAMLKPQRGNELVAITHLAFLKGRVLVAGMSNEEFTSTLRAIPFPFDETAKGKGAGIQIYHGAHGRFETASPVRVFTTYKIGDEDHLLAAYQCTPLVKIPVAQLKPGEKVKGTTVAELGNRNRPLSMIVYQKGGKDYVLIANSARGLMKVQLDGVDKIEGITNKVQNTAGLKYDTVKDVKGVEKMDAFDKDHAVVLVRAGGKLNLNTIEMP